jgi:hypothetical protein
MDKLNYEDDAVLQQEEDFFFAINCNVTLNTFYYIPLTLCDEFVCDQLCEEGHIFSSPEIVCMYIYT